MKTLYIIGNGFDIAHGLGTNYESFREWLLEKGHSYFVENMEMFFSHWDREGQRDQLWYDFERAIGACDFEETYDMFAQQSMEYFGEGVEYLRDIKNTSDEHFTIPLLYEMPQLFTQWIENKNAKIANIGNEKLRLKNIAEEDIFLTFNYTDTLEQAYDIPSSNICHIHNRVSAGEQPIVGHNIKFKINVPYDMTKGESELKQSLADVLNSYQKNYKSNINRNLDFFNQIDNEVENICCYGHSLGEIDLPYFKNIKKRISDSAHWIFYIYRGEDDELFMRNKNAVLTFIMRMRLDKNKCKAYDSYYMNQEIQLN